MCGIAGVIGVNNKQWVKECQSLLHHRGPDGSDVYFDPTGSVGLTHCRLSILDLSDNARQPMESASKRYWITYNGELYNFRDIRTELEKKGHRFRSTGDTEVLLAAWAEWGEDCLNRLNGIFAFAIWDNVEKTLTLVRDPVGVKPLYWTKNQQNTLFFASEMSALISLPHVSKEVSLEAIDCYLTFLWVPAPLTILPNIFQLEPGCLIRIGLNGKFEKKEYTNVFTDMRALARTPHRVKPEELWDKLSQSVERQLVSDVPVGVFLSGGIDSTGILAAARRATDNLTAYTFAFSSKDSRFEAASNDLIYAKEAAERYGVKHEVISLSADISTLLPRLIKSLDHPVGDHAPLASYLICEAASNHGAKVLLSGQGADEIFGGYPWQYAGVAGNIYDKIPDVLQSWLQSLTGALPGGVGGKWMGHLRRLKRFMTSAAYPWPERYAQLCCYCPQSLRRQLMSEDPSRHGISPAEDRYRTHLRETADLHIIKQMLYTDTRMLLPGLNLFYTDRTSMAHGVEVRVPFLDLDLLRYSATIAPEQLLSLRGRKMILKEAVRPHVPESVISRQKAGFGLPVRSWMKSSLGLVVQSELGADRVKKRGLWNPSAIEKLIIEQKTGREDRAYLLFALLSLEMWLSTHLDQIRQPVFLQN